VVTFDGRAEKDRTGEPTNGRNSVKYAGRTWSYGRLAAVAVAVLSMAGTMLVGAAGFASAASNEAAQATKPGVETVFFQIRARHSDKCLDLDTGVGGGSGNGVPVQQWECLGSLQINQLWQLINTGDGVTYYIKSLHSGKCLDVPSSANGVRVQQWECLGQQNVRWHVDWVTGSYYRIRTALAPPRCLDVDIAVPDPFGNGTPVQLWDCLSDQHNQQWRLLSS
jgi:Ricin-type beta-trefoil lectin domain-like